MMHFSLDTRFELRAPPTPIFTICWLLAILILFTLAAQKPMLPTRRLKPIILVYVAPIEKEIVSYRE